MHGVLLVGLGGFLGSIARYRLGELILHTSAQGRFPSGTFAVNVLGCLVVGVLAGFTTFSAFGLEAMSLIRRGDLGAAVLYSGGSVVLGIAAVWLGIRLVSVFPR